MAAASYAFGCVSTRRAQLAPGVMGTASQMIVGGAMLAATSLARGEPFATPTPRAVWALAYLVVLGSLVAYSAFGWLLKNTRPALATSYAYVNPVVALALGAALGGERFAAADFAGLARLTASGINCFARDGKRWKTRVFVPAHGVAEDAATGSAAGPLAIHLARHGRIGFGEEIEIDQGAEIGRPSRLYARVDGSAEQIERVLVGGSAVLVARGEFSLR